MGWARCSARIRGSRCRRTAASAAPVVRQRGAAALLAFPAPTPAAPEQAQRTSRRLGQRAPRRRHAAPIARASGSHLRLALPRSVSKRSLASTDALMRGWAKRQRPRSPQSDKAASPDDRLKRRCKGGGVRGAQPGGVALRCLATTPAPSAFHHALFKSLSGFRLGASPYSKERPMVTGLACVALARDYLSVNHSLTSGFAAVHPS